MSTGKPLDPDSVTCSLSVSETVRLHLRRADSAITWACAACRRTYRSGTLSCSSVECKELKLKGRTRQEAINMLLGQLDKMLEVVKPCDDTPGAEPKVLNTAMLVSELLSPHGHHLQGLKVSAWSTDKEATCNCDKAALDTAVVTGSPVQEESEDEDIIDDETVLDSVEGEEDEERMETGENTATDTEVTTTTITDPEELLSSGGNLISGALALRRTRMQP